MKVLIGRDRAGLRADGLRHRLLRARRAAARRAARLGATVGPRGACHAAHDVPLGRRRRLRRVRLCGRRVRLQCVESVPEQALRRLSGKEIL